PVSRGDDGGDPDRPEVVDDLLHPGMRLVAPLLGAVRLSAEAYVHRRDVEGVAKPVDVLERGQLVRLPRALAGEFLHVPALPSAVRNGEHLDGDQLCAVRHTAAG